MDVSPSAAEKRKEYSVVITSDLADIETASVRSAMICPCPTCSSVPLLRRRDGATARRRDGAAAGPA